MERKKKSCEVGRLGLGRRYLPAALVAVCWCAAGGSAYAGEGFLMDLSALLFNYEATNPNAKPGETIGEITIVERPFSTAGMQKFDLGADGRFGGGDDVLLDLARIGLGDSFDTLFTADVIKGQGNNNYSITGRLATTDTVSDLDDPSLVGDFLSTDIALFEGGFVVVGAWSTIQGRDAILQPGGAESWVFKGISEDTPAEPDGDSERGQVSLQTGRSSFDNGRLAEFQVEFGIKDLDTFFGSDRQNLQAGVTATVVPEPATWILLLLGAAAMRRSKRSVR